MGSFVFVHGGGDSGWSWHLVEARLRARGHRTAAPDLPADDDKATLRDYADTVIAAAEGMDRPVVVGQSLGAFTASLVATLRPVRALVLVSGMVPVPGESPEQWWDGAGFAEAVREQAARDGGLTGHEDPMVSFLHDVPRDLAEEALRRGREHPSSTAYATPWPLNAWPDVPTRYELCTEDRFFPPHLMRRLVRDRLGVEPEELAASHCAALARPDDLAALLEQSVDD